MAKTFTFSAKELTPHDLECWWSILGDLDDSTLKDIAEKALNNVYIFQYCDFNDGMARASKNPLFKRIKDYKSFFNMIILNEKHLQYMEDNNWFVLDLKERKIAADYDLLELLQNLKYNILIKNIVNDPKLMEEVTTGNREV